jgi:hypothetical protein
MERAHAPPSKETFRIKPIARLLKEEVNDELWIDPFAGNNSPALVTNDLNPNTNAQYHEDALTFMKRFEDNSVNGVLFDPPYSPRQIKECYDRIGLEVLMKTTQASFWSKIKDDIGRVLVLGGKVICFGWNSNGCGKVRGFVKKRILLVAHGDNHNDTIVIVENKVQDNLRRMVVRSFHLKDQ